MSATLFPISRVPAAWLVLATITASHAAAQSNDEKKAAVDIRLEQVPLEVEALGMSIYPPAGVSVAAQRVEGNVSIMLTEPISNPRWSMTLQILDSTLDIPTAEGQIEEHLSALQRRSTPFTLISNERTIIDHQPGQLCYIKQSTASGQDYITGWLILPAGIRSFLVASILAMPDSFEDFRPTLEASLDTIKITSREELSLRIRSEIEAGKRLLNSITSEELQALAAKAKPEWRRVYIPAGGETTTGSSDLEVGYMHIDTFAGKRGLVNPNRRELNYDDSEHEEGLVVQVYVRVLEGKDVRDVEMVYWMSWDQSKESFSIRGTRRQGQASLSEAITGVRTHASAGMPQPTLTVITMSDSTRVRDPAEWAVPDSYLSQALSWILPAMLPRTGETHTYAYYFFDMAMAQPSLQRRVDTWGPAKNSPQGNPSRWELTSRMGDGDQPLVSIYGNDGSLIKRAHPDGAVTEPIELLALKRLWESKGLPISADDLKRQRRKR